MSEETHNTTVTQPQSAQTTEKTTDPKQVTAPVKAPAPVAPQTVQTTEQVQPTAPTKTAEQVKPQAVQPTVQAIEPAKPQSTAPTAPATVKAAEPVKPQTVQPTETAQESVKPQITQPTEVTKLSDVIPTSKVWISGLIGNRQIDCLGPIEIPLKIDKPTYPFTPVPENYNYTNQVFDYGTGEWIATDAKSQGQQLTDLTKEVADLQQTITKHEKAAEISQAMSLQQMQMLMSITAKLDALTKKEGVK